MKLLTVLRNFLSKDKVTAPVDLPSAESAAVEPLATIPETVESSPPAEPVKLSLPRLAHAVLLKQVDRRHAFEIAKAYFGKDGVEDLSKEITAARKRWLPIPGTLRKTSDGAVYEADLNGTLRRVHRVTA